MARRKKKQDDWLDAAIGVGIGLLAAYFLKKLSEGGTPQETKVCLYCGHMSEKWARMCSQCRNTFPL